MEIGIFSRTFAQPTLEQVLDRVAAHQVRLVHFNFKSAGLDSLPRTIPETLCQRLRAAFAERNLRMISISATFNAIHPNKALRDDFTHRACQLIERARDLGVSVVSLCTGTRDADNMWRRHPDNDTPEAWQDLVLTLTSLLRIAERNAVTLGVEPERANVINSATKARRLLDEMESDYLKVIIDGANLFDSPADDMESVLEEAFQLLGSDVVLAHAKDLMEDSASEFQAAGSGKLDWTNYFRLLKSTGYDGPLVLHNLDDSQVAESIAFVKRAWDAV